MSGYSDYIVPLIILAVTVAGIIKKTDFITGEKRYVRIYYWK